MSEYTTIVVKGLESHPRKIVIDGVWYQVLCSADGHIPAQADELEQFVDCVRGGDLEGMKKKQIRQNANEVKMAARSRRESGYDF